jgi:chromosome segregation ATPase
MISGRQALAQIEDAVARARADERRLDAALRAAADEAARLRAERTAAFRELARVKLDALQKDGVIGELDAAERRALAILSDRREAYEGLMERRRQVEEREQAAEKERHARAAALEEALDAIEALSARVEADARVSPEWAAQRRRIEEADETARKAEEKAEVAERDREEKRKPYEADPLFMYLWNRKFGTAEYRSGYLVRFFDRKVARLVGYDKARANYMLLNEIPVRLREHAKRVREEVAAERARLTAVEREALEKAGLGPLEARAEEARAALEEAEARLAEAKDELKRIDSEHDASVLAGDTPYREAVEVLAAADSRQDLQTLYREAVQTPNPRDEALIRRIEGTETAIGQAEARMGAIRREMRDLVQRRAAIERERDEFRRRGYDNPYGGFGNEQVLANVLGGMLGGILQGAVLRDVLNQGYQQRRGPWDSDFGGGGPFQFPFPGGGGGGGFTTGGGFGGGGGEFRTGGGF